MPKTTNEALISNETILNNTEMEFGKLENPQCTKCPNTPEKIQSDNPFTSTTYKTI